VRICVELLLPKVLRAHVRRVRFWATREGGSWRRDSSLAGLKFVTTDLWVAYTQVVLRRGTRANDILAREIARETILHSEGVGERLVSQSLGKGRAHMQGNGGETGGRGAARGVDGRDVGGRLAEGARICLSALLLLHDQAWLGSNFSQDQFDNAGDYLIWGPCDYGTDDDDGNSQTPPSAHPPPHTTTHPPGREGEGSGGKKGQGRGKEEVGGGGAMKGAEGEGRGGEGVRAERERLSSVETLLMSVFFHNARQMHALSLYGGLLWVLGKVSLSLRILTEAGVEDWEQLQNVKVAGMGAGWTRDKRGEGGGGAVKKGGLSVGSVLHLLGNAGIGGGGGAVCSPESTIEDYMSEA
jgi:hypothetical protein